MKSSFDNATRKLSIFQGIWPNLSTDISFLFLVDLPMPLMEIDVSMTRSFDSPTWLRSLPYLKECSQAPEKGLENGRRSREGSHRSHGSRRPNCARNTACVPTCPGATFSATELNLHPPQWRGCPKPNRTAQNHWCKVSFIAARQMQLYTGLCTWRRCAGWAGRVTNELRPGRTTDRPPMQLLTT